MNMSSAAAYSADFLERISATAIVNQAVIKCLIARIPVTQENVILFVGDFADPSEPAYASLIAKIDRTIDDVFETGNNVVLLHATLN